MGGDMPDDGFRRLLGAPIALAVVVTYLALAAATLVLRALYGVAGETLRSLLPWMRRSRAISHADRMRFDEAR